MVAGATRGAGRGIAVQLGTAGATVYVTGRTTRSQRSEMNRPETIEETAALVDEAGGRGIAVQVDHLVPDEVRALVNRIEAEQGALHVLVNGIWGATIMEWDKTVWGSTDARGVTADLSARQCARRGRHRRLGRRGRARDTGPRRGGEAVDRAGRRLPGSGGTAGARPGRPGRPLGLVGCGGNVTATDVRAWADRFDTAPPVGG